jgi:hypothetical protein
MLFTNSVVEDTVLGQIAAIVVGVAVVLGQDILLDLHHARLAHAGSMRARRAETVVDCIMRMAVPMIMGVSVIVIAAVFMRMLVRRTVFMQMVVHMFALHRLMRVVVRCAVGMHVKMAAVLVTVLALLHRLAVYGRFSCAAAAYITH